MTAFLLPLLGIFFLPFATLIYVIVYTPGVGLVVSEPLVDLPGAWYEVPESSYGVVREGEDELHPFRPVHTANGG